MTADYTPGHALNDIMAVIENPVKSRAQLAKLTEATTRLYKAGQANERAAIVAWLRGLGGMAWRPADLAGMIERGEL